MSTRMTEADRAVALDVCRAARSRRGDKGRDDRRSLEALRHFAVHDITWRARPAEFGRWNSVWERSWRPSRGGVFEAFVQALAGLSKDGAARADVRQHRRARACLRRGSQRGQDGQALGRSRGGFPTKIHPKCGLDGRPLDFHLAGGEAGDSPRFETLLDIGPGITPRAVVTGKGCDAKANRDAARQRGICPLIPCRANAARRPARLVPEGPPPRPRPHRADHRQARALQAHRPPLRGDRRKLAANYAALIAFAGGLISVKSVHTA